MTLTSIKVPHEIWQAAARGLPCVSYSSLEAIKKIKNITAT